MFNSQNKILKLCDVDFAITQSDFPSK